MAVSTVNVNIKGTEYSFNTFTGTKGLKYLKQIIKVIGPSLTTFFSNADSEGVEAFALEKAVELLIDNLDVVDVEKLIIDLLKDVQKEGVPVNFDLDFAANYKVMFLLLIEVVKANFGDFFQDGGLDLL